MQKSQAPQNQGRTTRTPATLWLSFPPISGTCSDLIGVNRSYSDLLKVITCLLQTRTSDFGLWTLDFGLWTSDRPPLPPQSALNRRKPYPTAPLRTINIFTGHPGPPLPFKVRGSKFKVQGFSAPPSAIFHPPSSQRRPASASNQTQSDPIKANQGESSLTISSPHPPLQAQSWLTSTASPNGMSG